MSPKEMFLEKGYSIIDRFLYHGNEFVLYRFSEYNPMVYVTGDLYEWAFGLRWDSSLESIVKDYAVDEELRMIIKRKIAQ